jgi:hypothetical protein
MDVLLQELTLDEYEKILEEKRKALSACKAEERKVQADKAFESMQLVEKRNDEDVFIKVVLILSIAFTLSVSRNGWLALFSLIVFTLSLICNGWPALILLVLFTLSLSLDGCHAMC